MGQIHQKHLRQKICKYFDLADLELLASAMGLKIDNVRGDTLEHKAFGLISHCQQHNTFDRLIRELQEARPHIVWDERVGEPESTVARDDLLDSNHVIYCPLVTEPFVHTGWFAQLALVDRSINCVAVPIGYFDASAQFDVTNPNGFNLHLERFDVDVLDYLHGEPQSIHEGWLGGGGHYVHYSCEFTPKIGRYHCEPDNNHFDFRKLRANEMETYVVSFTGDPPAGTYHLQLSFVFVIGNKRARHKLSPFWLGYYPVSGEPNWWNIAT